MQENVLSFYITDGKIKHSLCSLKAYPLDPDPLSFVCLCLPIYVPALEDFFLLPLILLLIVLNAIICGSQAALFPIDQDMLEAIDRSHDPRLVHLSRLLKKPEKLHAALSVAYLFFNVTITVLLFLFLRKFPFFIGGSIGKGLLEAVIVITVLLLFTYFLPCLCARHQPIRFARRHLFLLRAIQWLNRPISSLLIQISTRSNRSSTLTDREFTMDELSKALEITSEDSGLNQEKEMLEGIIRFKDKIVNDIQVSRVDMVAIDIKLPFREVIAFIVDAGFSRIPVYEGNPDNIKGILYVKDLLPHLGKTGNFKWQSLIRPAYFVPGTKRIDNLLEEFRTNKIHMAIVVDEYGGTSGLVTMEDILEEIVGDISDEYDEELPLYTQATDGSYIFEGKTPIEEFIKITRVAEKDFEEISEEVDTLAGLLLELKEDFPKRKEVIRYKSYTFQAEEMSKKRITKVRYIPPKMDAALSQEPL